jgi:CRISPR-associated protein Cas1
LYYDSPYSYKIASPGITVSISALRLALKNQTLVVLADRVGWPHGFVTPAKLSGTIRGKREQFLAYQDFRGSFLAKRLAAGKLCNQRNLLKLLWKNRVNTESPVADKMYSSAEEIETLAKEIMEITPDRLKFPGRRSRGGIDPINMMLNFGYKAILFVETWKAIYYSGLDPYAGYLHADKPGKPLLFWIL